MKKGMNLIEEINKLKLFDKNTPKFLMTKGDNLTQKLWTLPILTTSLSDITSQYCRSTSTSLS